MGFKGRFPAQFDAKQRLAVPAKLRRNAPGGKAEQLVITLGFDGCLFLFHPERWDRMARQIDEQPFATERARFLVRKLFLSAEDVDLDGQSRILVPQPLIQEAKLGKEVIFGGALNRIEIWQPEALEKYMSEFSETYEQVAGEFLL